jgi:hypothetical protein
MVPYFSDTKGDEHSQQWLGHGEQVLQQGRQE